MAHRVHHRFGHYREKVLNASGLLNLRDSRTFLNISSFQILVMFRRGMFYNYLSVYLRFFLGLSVTETTLFTALPMVVNILSQSFVWGRLSDRLQLRRTLIIFGEISAAITTATVWYLHTLPASKHMAGYVIILGFSGVEIFWSMSNVSWSALLSDLYPAKARTGLQGRLMSIGAIGRIIGVWTGGLAYDGLARFYAGWGFDKGILFFIASGIMLASAIPMYFVPEGGIRSRSGDARPEALADCTPQGSTGRAAEKKFMVFLVAMVFIYFGLNSVALIMSQYLSLPEGFALSSGVLSYVLNAASLATLVIGFTVYRLSKRLNDSTLLLIGTTSAALYLVGFASAKTLPLIVMSGFLAGTAQVVIRASSYSYASKLIPAEKRARRFAFFDATHILSWGVPGTLVAGPIVDGLVRSGVSEDIAYRVAFLAAATLVVIGAIIFVFVNRMSECEETKGGESDPSSL
jgi:predicted MFS family arabinose efflux permease